VRALVLIAVLSSACGPTPIDVIGAALSAIERGDQATLSETIGEEYGDALGGRAELIRDVRELREAFPRISARGSELSTTSGASKLEAHVVGRIDADLEGEIAWHATGPLDVDLQKHDRFRIESGLLTDLRDVRALMDARRRALEANDAEAYARLLHPTYKDGDRDLEDTRARIRSDLRGVRVRVQPSLYKLEVRGPNAHVDEHYVLTVNDRALPAAVGRFTLVRAGGRWRIASGLYP
jgi:hypothetical protein